MLAYHAAMRSPHLIFIGDSSDAENQQKILTEVLIQEDRIDSKSAEEVIRKGFYSYLLQFCKVDWTRLYGSIRSTPSIKERFKSIP
ncbi:MAG: hypothetical protein HY877_01295, partial [Deltaproteobacteria bacterium]|nr:hypothetical protein [Deltaproteobacteria bacterium]